MEVTFNNWLRNHQKPGDGSKGLYRFCYPWAIFERIDFISLRKSGSQNIRTSFGNFKITSLGVAESNAKPNRLVHHFNVTTSETSPEDELPDQWNPYGEYSIVYEKTGFFVTLYKTFGKRELEYLEDTTKKFLSGKFRDLNRLNENLHGVVLHLCRMMIFDALQDEEGSIEVMKNKISLRNAKKEALSDFSCNGSLIKVFLNSKSAHYFALNMKPQKSVKLIYLNRNVDKHHQYNGDDISIKSIVSFLDDMKTIPRSSLLKAKALMFLYCGLSVIEDEKGLNTLRKQILHAQQPIEKITDAHLSLAYEFIDLKPKTEEELGLLCASANLLNACLNKKNRAYEGGQNLSKEIYSFKGKLKFAIEHSLKNRELRARISLCVGDDSLLLVQCSDFQFSFHQAVTGRMKAHINNFDNWSGVRLQTTAVSVFDYFTYKYLRY